MAVTLKLGTGTFLMALGYIAGTRDVNAAVTTLSGQWGT